MGIDLIKTYQDAFNKMAKEMGIGLRWGSDINGNMSPDAEEMETAPEFIVKHPEWDQLTKPLRDDLLSRSILTIDKQVKSKWNWTPHELTHNMGPTTVSARAEKTAGKDVYQVLFEAFEHLKVILFTRDLFKRGKTTEKEAKAAYVMELIELFRNSRNSTPVKEEAARLLLGYFVHEDVISASPPFSVDTEKMGAAANILFLKIGSALIETTPEERAREISEYSKYYSPSSTSK